MWSDILKVANYRISEKDKRLVNIIMSDGQPRTVAKLFDDIYDYISENKKLSWSTRRKQGRLQSTGIASSQKSIKSYLSISPNYEKTPINAKGLGGRQLYEYVYIGGE